MPNLFGQVPHAFFSQSARRACHFVLILDTSEYFMKFHVQCIFQRLYNKIQNSDALPQNHNNYIADKPANLNLGNISLIFKINFCSLCFNKNRKKLTLSRWFFNSRSTKTKRSADDNIIFGQQL